MATTGTILAKNMKLYIGSAAITCQTDASISMSTNMFETTCKDSGADSAFFPGSKTWTASGSGNLAFDATYGGEELFAAWNAQTSMTAVLKTGVTGDKVYTGTAYISSLSINSSGNDEPVTFDYELQGTGALVESTAP